MHQRRTRLDPRVEALWPEIPAG